MTINVNVKGVLDNFFTTTAYANAKNPRIFPFHQNAMNVITRMGDKGLKSFTIKLMNGTTLLDTYSFDFKELQPYYTNNTGGIKSYMQKIHLNVVNNILMSENGITPIDIEYYLRSTLGRYTKLSTFKNTTKKSDGFAIDVVAKHWNYPISVSKTILDKARK